ncbi:unnamed protein product [Didymodactylos carnosus]|uniref:SAM domain-containing protein n=1 Tax=Didymodactylos carnosus TaxID=1234261 RepID=A0A8S2TSY0_9BILA|nr:unnamed protein product [Didymodactylos carnosus]CAF4303774.1 unnamed protein product [Didymodactylos carnosus]
MPFYYSRNTAKFGSLKKQMNLRYEAKHRLLKQLATRCNSFINVSKTVSKRVQLRQCYELMHDNILKSNGTSSKITKRKMASFKHEIQEAMKQDFVFKYENDVDTVKWLISEKGLMDWTVEKVSEWLCENGMSVHADKFKQENVDGASLFGLTEDETEALLTIMNGDGNEKKPSIGTKAKFRSIINELRKQQISKLPSIRVLAILGLDEGKKVQLIKCIHTDVTTKFGNDFCPTAVEFERMTNAVKQKYPSLCKVFSEDMSVLSNSLKRMFTRERHISASPSEVVQRKRLSYGHSTAGRKLKIQKVDKARRKEYLIKENEQQLDELLKTNEHEEQMIEMIRNNQYDVAQLKAKLNLTREK